MSRNAIETALGAVVLIVAVGFFIWAYGRSDVGNPGGYTLNAKFTSAEGLDPGTDVRMAGIKVGQIVSTDLDSKTFQAVVQFSVRQGIELPDDSSAAVVSASLLGGRYLRLEPGGDEKVLKDGDTVQFTQSAVNIEELVGKYIFGQGGGQGQGGGGAQGQAPAGEAGPGGGAGAPGGGANPFKPASP